MKKQITVQNFGCYYVLDKTLGTGSYSVVKHAVHRQTGKPYAVKVVDKHKLSSTDRIGLRHEIRILSDLSHPNVISLIDVVEDDNVAYLVTEYMKHGDLFDAVVKKRCYNEKDVQRIMASIISGVEACHSRNIIHRDLKPENVLLHNESVKLCDFGFAAQLVWAGEKLTETCGTPGYACPELLSGKPYGKAVDIFSLGVIMYILLCGYPPFPMKLKSTVATTTSSRHKKLPTLRFPKKEWGHVSTTAIDLITSMLRAEASSRPTVVELSATAWVKTGKALKEKAETDASLKRSKSEMLKRETQIRDMTRTLTSQKGISATKFGRNGQSHVTRLRMINNETVLQWQSKLVKRSVLKIFKPFVKEAAVEEPVSSSTIHLSNVSAVISGQNTKVFQRYHNNSSGTTNSCESNKCFSLITKDRTLDLAVTSNSERNVLVNTIRRYVARSTTSTSTDTIDIIPPSPSQVLSPTNRDLVAMAAAS